MEALATAEARTDDDPRQRRFHALYRGEYAFVWSAAQHLGVPPGMVDEVVQDVFLTAYRRLEHLRFEVSPRAWLYGVTRRVAFRYRRGAARRTRRLANFAEMPRPTADAPQQRHDDAQQLARMLEPLSEGTRSVWEMTELLGMSAPEIASELGLPLNTVYSRLRLARRQLEQCAADPEQIAAWRDALRHHHSPPPTAERRSWALLVPMLRKPGGAAGLLAWAKTQVGMATVAISAGALAVGVTLSRGPAPAPARLRPSEVAAPAKLVVTPPTPAPVTPEATPPPTPRIEAPVRDRLAEEVALIDRLQARLGANDLSAALALVAEHARRFPEGALVDVREAAQIDALCRGGEAERAEASAHALLLAHPGSAVAQRFVDFSCAR